MKKHIPKQRHRPKRLTALIVAPKKTDYGAWRSLIVLGIGAFCGACGVIFSWAPPAYADQIVLATVENPPTAYFENGRLTGLQIELIREAFRRAGEGVEIRLMPWARCLSEARTGQVDGVFALFPNEEREKTFQFSSEILIEKTVSLFIRKQDGISYDGALGSLAKWRFGVVNKTVYGPKFDQALRDGILPNVEYINDVDSLLRMLSGGRIDIFPAYRWGAIDAARRLGLESEIVEVRPPIEIVPGYLAFTRERNLTAVSAKIDEALRSMKRDGTASALNARFTAESN